MRLIDADALKEYITKAYEEMKSEFKTDKYRDIAELVTESFCMDIDEAPTIDPVRHGHWIKNEDRHGWHCSECKEDNNYAYSWSGENGKYEFQDSYCPNCGAKMENEG